MTTQDQLVFFRIVIFAILLAILMAISSIEYIIIKGSKIELSDDKANKYKQSSQWALIGIGVVVLLATFSNEPIIREFQQWLFIVPAAFVFIWFYHHKDASETINNFAVVQLEYDAQLSDIIQKFVTSNSKHEKHLSVAEIYEGVKLDRSYPGINGDTINTIKRLYANNNVIGGFLNTLQQFSCTPEKVEFLLKDLVSKRDFLKVDSNGLYYS